MPNVTKEMVNAWIDDMIAQGEITQDANGNYVLGEKLQAVAQDLINRKPELYKEIFPDRVH